jgi:hypothetical protein
MSSLGKNGRFVNQLFQYLFLRLAAKVQGMCLQVPDWIGRELYDLDEPPVLAPLKQTLIDGAADVPPELNVFSNPERLITEGGLLFRDTDVWGYFQFNMRAYEPYRDFIRDLYSPKGSVGKQLAAGVERVRLFGKKIIGVHLRRGDYGYGIFFRAPCAWYEKWVKEMNFDPEQYLIYICSEDAGKYTHRFPGYQVLSGEMLGISWEMDAALFDFHVLCESDVLAISNSTFSFMASLLNKSCRHFFRPCFEVKGLQPYEPWGGEPLIRSEVSPEEHGMLMQLD